MDAPKKTYSTTANKSTPLKKGSGKHAVNPTMQNPGYGGGKSGAHSLDGAQGSKGKYC